MSRRIGLTIDEGNIGIAARHTKQAFGRKNTHDILANWLPRHTGTALEQPGEYILRNNFSHFVELFAQRHVVKVHSPERPMPNATADGITVINLGRRSHNMGNVMNLLSAVESEAVLPPGQMRRRQEEPRGRPGVATREKSSPKTLN